MIVIDGDIAYNFWRWNWTSNTTATAQAYGEANVVTGTGWGALRTPTAENNWSSVLGAGVSADGSSELGGLLVKAQTDTGTINHALQLAVDNSLLAPGYVAPAIGTDGYTAGAPLQEGQLLAIAPGTPMPSGLSPLGQEVFRALQQYGAYITERGGGQTALRIQQNAYDATTISALDADVNKLLPMLKLVSGGTPTTSPTTPTVTPAVTQATATPGTGIEHAGDVITLALGFNEAVTVTGTPTLQLNDGNVATYAGGSGTSTLTFKTTVAATDTNTSALAITGVNLPSGVSIKDAAGVAANLSGAVKTFTGLQIDPVLPAVTQATANPTTGTEHVGDVITLALGFNEAVTVTGTPALSLNDGGTATYVGGSGTNTLTFKTTVASTNTSTSALAITGVNLSNGAIKDASGVAANLAGAVKTFSGLQIDPTSTTTPTPPTTPTAPTTPTQPSTPSVISPDLTIADDTLWVAGRGGTVDLGTKVTTTDSNDRVTVHITGLPKYESITDNLDGQTFRGRDITLTAAQVNSGLTLTSTYRGGGYPVAELTLTASATDPSTGAVATAAPQTITVTDPRPTTTTSSHGHHAATDHHPVAATTAVTPTVSQTIEPTDHQQVAGANTGCLANRGFALLQQLFDPAGSSLATTAAHPVMAADHPSASGSTMASLASQSFALLNQYLAAHTGAVDPGQIVAAVSQATGWGHDALLARPQH
ncbi:hypothetical protein A5906_04835 [Bradyrhizobium sacchari]|nr:hypothetical protein A5906_04835 [Bradyrhizobium sacchari]